MRSPAIRILAVPTMVLHLMLNEMLCDQINALISQLKKAEHRQRHACLTSLAVTAWLRCRFASFDPSSPGAFASKVNSMVRAKAFLHQDAASFHCLGMTRRQTNEA